MLMKINYVCELGSFIPNVDFEYTKNKLEALVEWFIKIYKETGKEADFRYFDILINEDMTEEDTKKEFKRFTTQLIKPEKIVKCTFNPQIIKRFCETKKRLKNDNRNSEEFYKKLYLDKWDLKDKELKNKIYELFKKESYKIEALYD